MDRLAEAHGELAELAYIVHGERPCDSIRLPLTPGQLARKYAAILHHRSQLVLSKRRFLSYATEAERFVDPGTASPAHRVVGATFTSGTLSLRLVPATPVAALRATLHVLTEDNPGWVVRLRSRSVKPWQHEIEFPMDRAPARLLVKCEAPHIFFDAAGWREFHICPSPEAAGPSTPGRVARSEPTRSPHREPTAVAGRLVARRRSAITPWPSQRRGRGGGGKGGRQKRSPALRAP